MFWWDLLFTIPFDGIVLEALGGADNLDPDTVLFIQLLQFIRLGRLYNLFGFFATLDHKMTMSQFSLHGSAKGLPHNYQPSPTSASPTEAIAMTIFLLYSLVLSAYILGTITMLVAFSKINKVPKHLEATMHNYLELYFKENETSDAMVLDMYPSSIRRKPVKQCYLMKGTSTKFLDALISSSRIELFNANVQLLYEGDLVNSLNIIMEGTVWIDPKGGSTSFSRREEHEEEERCEESSDSMIRLRVAERLRHPKPG
eukprot:gene4380-14505_t